MGQTYSTLGVGKYCKATQRAVFCQLVLKQFLGEGQNISGSSLQGLLRSISWNPFIVVGFSKDHRSKQSLPIISAWNHPQNWSGMMWLSDLQLQTNGKTTHMINNHLYCTFTIFYHPFCHLEELTKFVHPPRFSHDLVGKATFNPQTDCGNEEIWRLQVRACVSAIINGPVDGILWWFIGDLTKNNEIIQCYRWFKTLLVGWWSYVVIAYGLNHQRWWGYFCGYNYISRPGVPPEVYHVTNSLGFI